MHVVAMWIAHETLQISAMTLKTVPVAEVMIATAITLLKTVTIATVRIVKVNSESAQDDALSTTITVKAPSASTENPTPQILTSSVLKPKS